MKSGSIHHDGDRITHCDATPLVLATGRSPASAVFVRSRSTNLSRSTAPPRTHSRNRRRTLPWIVPRLATTFERRSNYSASSVRGPRIPIDRAYDIDALPTRGFLLWRLSNAGHFPAWRRSTVVGRHPKPFTEADLPARFHNGPYMRLPGNSDRKIYGMLDRATSMNRFESWKSQEMPRRVNL